MSSKHYLEQLNEHLSHLYAFARQMNELDFAVSLSGEFRGMQDAGWSTTITAQEVFEEITKCFDGKQEKSKSEFRVALMLYCQLAEAGGVYETLKNILGVVTLKPYLLWPFTDLVRVAQNPKRIIGPNANATFRDLAITAKAVGLTKLSELFEGAFRDDLRNGISHADYVIWDDGVRLRKRNGGYATKLSFSEINEAFTRGVGFFQILMEANRTSVRSFNPPREIVGRFSANFPMPWTVHYDPASGSFGIKGSSPGPVVTPEYERQVVINGLLGGKVLALFTIDRSTFVESIEKHIFDAGFEPNYVILNEGQMCQLIDDVERQSLWDPRQCRSQSGGVLLVSPWGFRTVSSKADFDELFNKPIVDLNFD